MQLIRVVTHLRSRLKFITSKKEDDVVELELALRLFLLGLMIDFVGNVVPSCKYPPQPPWLLVSGFQVKST